MGYLWQKANAELANRPFADLLMNLLDKARHAQYELRSTQINWREECLFNCDDLLSEIIADLESRTGGGQSE